MKKAFAFAIVFVLIAATCAIAAPAKPIYLSSAASRFKMAASIPVNVTIGDIGTTAPNPIQVTVYASEVISTNPQKLGGTWTAVANIPSTAGSSTSFKLNVPENKNYIVYAQAAYQAWGNMGWYFVILGTNTETISSPNALVAAPTANLTLKKI